MARRDGRGRAAVAAYWASSRTTASWDNGEPAWVQNTGSWLAPRRSASQWARWPAVWAVSGVHRCFLPLPVHWTCGSALRWMSSMVSVVSSDTRSPVWAASRMRAWSRRPCQVPRSGAASSASSSSRVRKFTGVFMARLAGMASTRAISAACSGARGAAQRNSEWIAVRRALRVAVAPAGFQVLQEAS